MRHELDSVLRPRSVAVIGASRQPGSIGGVIFQNLLSKALRARATW